MDRQKVKPNRPSLLANSDASAADRAPAAGRILADVEQGRSRTTGARDLRRRPLLAMLAVAVLALCGVLAWNAFDDAASPDVASQAPTLSTPSSASPHAAVDPPTSAPATSTIADTAAIVDADNPFGGKSVHATPGPNPFGENANPQRPAKRANPFNDARAPEKRSVATSKRAVPATGAAAIAAARTHAPAKVAAPLAAKAKSEGDQTALGSSLLSNIVTAEATPNSSPHAPAVLAVPAVPAVPAARPESKVVRPQTGADHEVLDALIEQVDAAGASGPSAGPVGNSPARIDPIGVSEPLASAEKLQRDLRRCPKANTTAGVDCRIKACRDYGGKNAACAMKH